MIEIENMIEKVENFECSPKNGTFLIPIGETSLRNYRHIATRKLLHSKLEKNWICESALCLKSTMEAEVASKRNRPRSAPELIKRKVGQNVPAVHSSTAQGGREAPEVPRFPSHVPTSGR